MKMPEYDLSQIYDVDLAAPAYQRWLPVADKIGDQIISVTEDVVDYVKECFSDLPTYIRPLAKLAIHGTVSITGRTVGLVARLFGQDYGIEIRSIARRVGVSYPQLLLGNLMYDVSQLAAYRHREPAEAVGCSSFSCNLPDGSPVLARNMDWIIPDSIGRNTILIRFHKGHRSYLSVGVAGKVGVLSAMRPGKWAVTMNQAPVAKVGVRRMQTPVLQHLRNACDQFGGYRKLIRSIQSYETMTPFFAHVVGTKPHQHTVVNGFSSSYDRREIDGEWLVQTNHFPEREYRYLNDAAEWEDETGQVWMCDSRPRYKALKRRLGNGLPANLDEAVRKLKREPVTNENTRQTMAFCPSRGEMRLKVAQ